MKTIRNIRPFPPQAVALLAQGCRNLITWISQQLFLLIAFILLVLSVACNTTVLLANFNNDTVGSPPSTTQSTGTVTLETGPGSLTVVAAPNTDLPSNKWCRITHTTSGGALQTKLIGNFTRFGTGDYGMLASLHIPRGAGVVTVGFEASSQSPLPFGQFLHLDFMPEGDVRIDDSNVRFGHFTRDRNFVLSVHLIITETSAKAEITLIGGSEATGNLTVDVPGNVLRLAQNFGAVAFEVGSLHNATFFVDDVIVTRK